MFEIEANLWQSPASAVDESDVASFDVVFWLCGGLHPKPPFGKTLVIDYSIPDNSDGLSPVVFKELFALAKLFKRRRVLTVCKAGVNRSGLLSAMTLYARGHSMSKSIELVKAHNNALQNPGFVRQLNYTPLKR